LRSFARRGEIPIPDWAKSLGAQPLVSSPMVETSNRETRSRSERAFSSGFTMIVPLTDTTRYLDYLCDRLINASGTIRVGARLKRIGEVPRRFEVIVNCAGIGAGELVPDREMEPHRGQVAIVSKVDLPWATVC